MATSKMFVAHISYDANVVLPVNDKGEPSTARLVSNLEEFGATNIEVMVGVYTGAGEHEDFGSSDPGITIKRCVKCGLPNAPSRPAVCTGFYE